jgi:Mg2+ and Co2+ transporter CorA
MKKEARDLLAGETAVAMNENELERLNHYDAILDETGESIRHIRDEIDSISQKLFQLRHALTLRRNVALSQAIKRGKGEGQS